MQNIQLLQIPIKQNYKCISAPAHNVLENVGHFSLNLSAFGLKCIVHFSGCDYRWLYFV